MRRGNRIATGPICLSVVIALCLCGCAHRPATTHRAAATPPPPPVLSGQPSWVPIGDDVYHEGDCERAGHEVMAVRIEPRWFIGFSRPATTQEFKAAVEQQRQLGIHLSHQEGEDGSHELPTVPPYPKKLENLPLDDQGVRLSMEAAAAKDSSLVLLRMKLSSQSRPVWREIEHRWTNTLPFLFVFYVDGQAVQVPRMAWGRERGVNGPVKLVEPGGQRRWAVKVDAGSLRKLLPDERPHELAIVAAFSERQHEYFAGGEDVVAYLNNYLRPSHDEKQVLVRSNAVRVQWSGTAWRTTGTAPPTTQELRIGRGDTTRPSGPRILEHYFRGSFGHGIRDGRHYVSVTVWQDQRESARQDLIRYLRGTDANVRTELFGKGWTDWGLTARQFWALALADMEGANLEIREDDDAAAREQKIGQMLQQLSEKDR